MFNQLYNNRYLIKERIFKDFKLETYIALDTFNNHNQVFIYHFKLNKEKQFIKDLKHIYNQELGTENLVEETENYLVMNLVNQISLYQLLNHVKLTDNDLNLIIEAISKKLANLKNYNFLETNLNLIFFDISSLKNIISLNKISKLNLINVITDINNIKFYNLYYQQDSDYMKIYNLLNIYKQLNIKIITDNREVKNIYNGFHSDIKLKDFNNYISQQNSKIKEVLLNNHLYEHNEIFTNYREIYNNIIKFENSIINNLTNNFINNFEENKLDNISYEKIPNSSSNNYINYKEYAFTNNINNQKQIKKKSKKNYLVFIVILLFVLANIYLTYNLYIQEPTANVVPELVALDKDQAIELLKDNNLNYNISYQSSNAPYNQILTQDPGLNSVIDKNNEINLKISSGKYYFKMPEFRNLNQAMNFFNPKEIKFYIQPVKNLEKSNNSIEKTEPKAGQTVTENDKIILYTVNNNLETVNIPDFQKLSLNEALEKAKENNLKIIVKKINTHYNDKKIIKQEPSAYNNILENSYITLYITNNQYIKVPNLENKSLNQAIKTLNKNNLRYKVIDENNTSNKQSNNKNKDKQIVKNQVPNFSKQVLKSSYILLYI